MGPQNKKSWPGLHRANFGFLGEAPRETGYTLSSPIRTRLSREELLSPFLTFTSPCSQRLVDRLKHVERVGHTPKDHPRAVFGA